VVKGGYYARASGLSYILKAHRVGRSEPAHGLLH
jgi:hypothetical protein